MRPELAGPVFCCCEAHANARTGTRTNGSGNGGCVMKSVVGLSGLLSLTVALGLSANTPVSADQQLVVVGNKAECPGAGFTTIQAAVNAAPLGASIRVCPGTYNEQVTIISSVTIKGDKGAVVMPSPMIQSSMNLATGDPIAAVILVKNTAHVTIEGLAVDGAASQIICRPNMVGIYYRNASGKINDVVVKNMKPESGGGGCQSGLGIFVQSGNGGSSSVTVERSSVHDYDKNGITANESGTEVRVKENVVTGLGPTTDAAQNGIQVGFGATGQIEENTIINHIWSPCLSVSQCTDVAAGLLIFEANDVRIAKNTVGKSQTGIYLQGSHAKVEANNVFNTDVFDGIAVVGNNNRLEDNTITHSDEAAVFLLGNGNKITENTINETPIGVWKFGGGGNFIEGNRYINTAKPVLDPLPVPTPGRSPNPFR